MDNKYLKVFKIARIICYLIIVLNLALIPLDIVESGSICIIYNIFNVKCFTCGMTRAYSNVLHLNIIEALSYNYLIIIVFPMSVLLIFEELITLIKNRTGIIDKIILKIYIK